MKRELIFGMQNAYRDDFNIYGYRFGRGEKSACIVGSMRGNEIQQMFICSRLVKALKEIEAHGDIVGSHGILVIPSVNHPSMNIGKRFWAVDNTDINRMFPGDPSGETTKRIAAGIFEEVRHYSYGIQFSSLYMSGAYVPHVRMLETGYHNPSLANLFGLPYVVIRKPTPYDKATLNFNWQTNNTSAFSVFTAYTDTIDEASAKQAVASVLRFLTRMGIIRYNSHSGYIASVINENDLTSVKSDDPGLWRAEVWPGEEVARGDLMATIFDPYEGEILSQILSPTDGIVFFSHNTPLVMENEVVFKIIRRLHS